MRGAGGRPGDAGEGLGEPRAASPGADQACALFAWQARASGGQPGSAAESWRPAYWSPALGSHRCFCPLRSLPQREPGASAYRVTAVLESAQAVRPQTPDPWSRSRRRGQGLGGRRSLGSPRMEHPRKGPPFLSLACGEPWVASWWETPLPSSHGLHPSGRGPSTPTALSRNSLPLIV